MRSVTSPIPPVPAEGLRLAQVASGQRLRIEGVDAGKRLLARLIAMGLAPATEARVMLNRGGAVVLATGETRVALGRGMAEKILVRLL